MRITNGVTYTDFLRNLNTNATIAQKTMNQISSSKEIHQASDNPLLASKIIDLTMTISQSKTYGDTMKDGIAWTNTQDSSLDGVNKSMLRIRSLIQSSANDTNGPDEYRANRAEISQEIRSIVDSLNTNYDGRYIFSGQNTLEKPFSIIEKDGEITGISYDGDENELEREIGQGVTIKLPTNGQSIMEFSSEGMNKNLGDFFTGVLGALDTGDTEKLSGQYLKEVDQQMENITNVRTKIGAVSNRLTAGVARNDTEQNQLKEILSNNQDVDVAQKYMEYQNQLTAYRTTLAMGTKIMQTSILDYIR